MRVLVAVLLLALCACEREQNKSSSSEPPPPRDAAIVPPVDARIVDTELQARLDALEPRDRPPPPIKRKHRRGDCRTEYAPRPARDPNPMCRVRGGTFLMGDGSRTDTGKRTPTTVADFDIDQFEVTTVQAARFLNAHGNECPGLDVMNHSSQMNECVAFLEPTGIRQGNGRFTVEPGRELYTASFSWEGSMRYCAWAGKQVPTSAQWEYAGAHDLETGRDLVYPWGDEWLPRRTRCDAAGCLSNPPRSMDKPRVGSPVGLFDGTRGRGDGSSAWGVHDLAGSDSELVFECAEPNVTCKPGGYACPCRKLVTSGDDTDRHEELRLTYRIDHTALRAGTSALRCARLRHGG